MFYSYFLELDQSGLLSYIYVFHEHLLCSNAAFVRCDVIFSDQMLSGGILKLKICSVSFSMKAKYPLVN